MESSSICLQTSLVAQMVKRLPTMRKTRVQSLGWEDLLEKEMATHSSILGWKIPWMEEPGRLQSMWSQRVGHDWATSLNIYWNSAFKWEYLSFSPLLFASLLFTAICKTSSDNHFAFSHFFSMGMVLIPVSYTMSRTSSIVHQALCLSDLVP